MNIIEANITAPDAFVAIVIARFNDFININLLKGATNTLKRIGKIKDENITIIWVPGAYELPLIASVLSKTSKYSAIIALATIIRGDTAHFEYIANSVSNNLSYIALKNNIPIIFGVLTTENVAQAIERSGIKGDNKGVEAALTALEMINILRIIEN